VFLLTNTGIINKRRKNGLIIILNKPIPPLYGVPGVPYKGIYGGRVPYYEGLLQKKFCDTFAFYTLTLPMTKVRGFLGTPVH